MLQRYFDGSLKPISPHVDDIVETVAGGRVRRGDALVDSLGHYHATEEEVDDAECAYREERAEWVHEVINNHCKWTEEYTEHEDYGDAYAYCALENIDESALVDDITDYIEAYVDLKDGEARKLAARIVDRLDGSVLEVEHCSSEYASWEGNGVVLWSFAVGEVEAQIEVSEHPELAELDEDELEAALESYRGDAYLYERTSYDRETNTRTRMGYVDRGTITYYATPGGAWHYYIPGDYIKDQVDEYLEDCEDEGEGV